MSSHKDGVPADLTGAMNCRDNAVYTEEASTMEQLRVPDRQPELCETPRLKSPKRLQRCSPASACTLRSQHMMPASNQDVALPVVSTLDAWATARSCQSQSLDAGAVAGVLRQQAARA